MVIKIPRQHTFPESLKQTILDKTGSSLPEWEISVSMKDCIAWSIVLTYLMSTNFKDGNDFQRRLKLLTGNDVKGKSKVKKSIESFNPFRNRHACFYDKVLKTVVDEFKIRMDWSNLKSVDNKLTAVSLALDCPIVVINYYKKPKISAIVTRNRESCKDAIVLLSTTFAESEIQNSNVNIFNFLIGSQSARIMRKAALKYYLKETKLSKKEINILLNIKDKNDSFLIALLKSHSRNTVVELYRSPYVISKLFDATYDMDPRTKDTKGLSALYYALVLSSCETEIFYKLYYFAASNCCKNEGSYRNPDSNILSNLCYMKELLSSDMSNIESLKDHPKYKVFEINFAQIIRFNDFLTVVGSKILKIKSMLNYYETTNEHIFEASKRRDVIVVILETYNKFFHWDDIPKQLPLENYITYRNYYNLIDMGTAIHFFYNIVFLKERLSLKDDYKQFSETESSLLISVMYHTVFERVDILEIIRRCMRYEVPELYCDWNSLFVFPLLKRVDTLEKLNIFSESLQKVPIKEDNVVENIPENVIYSTFCFHREIKDFIELGRLKEYMKTGIKQKVTDVKSVLVVERVLQVMGEYTEWKKNEDFSFKKLLFLCLPKEISVALRKLRNQLTHLDSHIFPIKYACENNFSLFRSIQSEMRQIESHFKLVYDIMKLDMGRYIFDQLEDELKRVKDGGHIHAYFDMNPLDLLERIILFIKTHSLDILQKYMTSCQAFLKIALKNVEKELNDISSAASEEPEVIKQKNIYILSPLKWFLELLKKYGMDNTATVIDTFKTLEESNTLHEIKEMGDTFIKKCTDFNSEITKGKRKKKLKPMKSIEYIEYFSNILKGSLPDKKKGEIWKDFSHWTDSFALDFLVSPDPTDGLENILPSSSVKETKCNILSMKTQCVDEIKEELPKSVDGRKPKNTGLSHLLNRVKLLKKILIQENEELSNLWYKIKSKKSRQLIDNKILDRYLKDSKLRVAAEMLLFDCMILFQNIQVNENFWIKSSRLYNGMKLRNVISHGSPLLESLCSLLDPEDLPSELIKQMILLIEAKDCIEAILELYEQVDEDYTKCHEVINSGKSIDKDSEDVYNELRSRIVKCTEWEKYDALLKDPLPPKKRRKNKKSNSKKPT